MAHLSEKLRNTRKARRLTHVQAARLMPNVSAQGLRHLENVGPDLKGGDLRIRTVADIINAYWPRFNLTDFVDCGLEVRRP